MNDGRLVRIAQQLVERSNELRLRHVPKHQGHVSYCCIFCQSDQEFNELNHEAQRIGRLANNTPTGPVYVVPVIQTKVGPLRIIKVRKPDKTRPEKGDADFALKDYQQFKTENLGKPGFKLIERDHFEMIELMDAAFDVRAYFSNPPVEEHPGIKEALAAR